MLNARVKLRAIHTERGTAALLRAGAPIALVQVARLHYAGVRSHIRLFRDSLRTCMLAVWCRFLERPQPSSPDKV